MGAGWEPHKTGGMGSTDQEKKWPFPKTLPVLAADNSYLMDLTSIQFSSALSTPDVPQGLRHQPLTHISEMLRELVEDQTPG